MRLIEYGMGGDFVAIPVDKYGRVMVTAPDDGNVRYCPWWVTGDVFSTFDDAADVVLINAMKNFGFVECLTDLQDGFTVNLDDIEETLTWNDKKKDFNLNIPLWQNAQANLKYRAFTLNGGTTIYAVIDELSGELVVYTDGINNTRYLEYRPDNAGSGIDEIFFVLLSQHPELETATPGLKEEGFYVLLSDFGDGTETSTIVNTDPENDIFVVNVNMDGQYRPGSADINVQYRMSIYADAAASQPLIPGVSYNQVYARIIGNYGFNDMVAWSEQGAVIGTPTTDYPEDNYMIGWSFNDMTVILDGPITQGVYTLQGDIIFSSEMVTHFI